MPGSTTATHPRLDQRAVLIADPEPERLRSSISALERECEVEVAQDGEHACAALTRGRHAAALVSTGLPNVSGLEALRRLAGIERAWRPLVVAVGPAGDVRLQVIRTHKLADAVQATPCPEPVLLRHIWSLLDLAVERRIGQLPPAQRALVKTTHGLLDLAAGAIARGNGLPAAAVAAAGQAVIEALGSGGLTPVLGELRAHHDHTYVHSVRVAAHLAAFAIQTGMRDADALLLAQAGLLHDIGKTAIPTAILDKPGPLTDAEWVQVHRHPAVGGEVLRRSLGLPPQLVAVTERHHERLDGSGYPAGLAGAAIDEPSLLCAIADVHTALTDRRAYRDPVSDDAAFARMRELGGRQLDRGLLCRYEQVVRDTSPASSRPATLLPA